MVVLYDKLGEESRCQIQVFGFNATGDTIYLKGIGGEIRCEYGADKPEVFSTPYLVHPQTIEIKIEHLGEIRLQLGQNVSAPVAQQLAARLDENKPVDFYLTELDIMVTVASGNTIRLPIWDAISLLNQRHPLIYATVAAIG